MDRHRNRRDINILVVDDTLENLKLLSDILTTAGYKVRPADNSNLALRSIEVKLPDLILLDVRMPEMDGYHLCRVLKERAVTREIPVLFVSALKDPMEKVQAFEAGGVDFINKPIQREEVLARVDTHLALSAARKALVTSRDELEKRVMARTAELVKSNESMLGEIEKRKQSEEKYRLLADNATDVICVWEGDGELQFISPSMALLSGFSPHETMRQSLKQIMTENSYMKLQKLLGAREHIQDQRPLRLEIELRCKNGGAVWTEMVSKTMYDDRGAKIGMLGIFRDITERKHSEEERSMLESQLRRVQKLEAIGTLANGIAHDFNNILSCILGYAELAKMKIDVNNEIHKDLTEILKAGTRARDLVKQILTFSRHTDSVWNPVIIAPIIKEVLKFLKASLPSTIEIISYIKAPAGTVVGDPTQIHQILMNLCTNAAYAMKDKGGELVICIEDVSPKDQAIAFFGKERIGEYLHLSVKDTGYGIRKEILDRIFDPFFTTKPRDEGTGMGLSVVHGIVKLMGGEIAVESQVGQGTAIHILLPKCAESAAPEFSSETVSGGKGRILLVDDEEGVIQVHSNILKQNGFEVTATTSSPKALTLFRNDPNGFDLVLTDMTMPKMTGIELAEQINKINEHIPILICTGFSNTLTDKDIHRFGIRQVVMKPMIARELVRTIKNALNAGGG